MYCSNCAGEIHKGDKFCGSCGSRIETSATARQPVTYPRPESLDAYVRLTTPMKLQQKRLDQVILGTLGTITVLGFVASWFAQSPAGWAGSTGVAVIALGYRLLPNRDPYLSSNQYYQIPHSQTDNHKPRCIMCGHVGIYTHGQYKTSTVFHDCAKCGVTLYVS